MKYWLINTSAANFRHDREVLKFKFQGLPHRSRKAVHIKRKGENNGIGSVDEIKEMLFSLLCPNDFIDMDVPRIPA